MPSAARRPTRALMIYDADCAFCARLAGVVQRRLSVQVDAVPMPSVDLPSLGVDPQRARREMPFLGPDGTVSYGHLAWADILSTGGPVLRLLGGAMRSRALSPAARAAYGWVAVNRHRMPGATRACELPERQG